MGCNCSRPKTAETVGKLPTPKTANEKVVKGKPDGAPEAPDDISASHRAIRLLGKGAAADTWLFADRERDRLVAVKLFPRPIPRSQRNSTLREIMCQMELGPGHINLINVYEAILTQDHLALVMEVAEGGSLTTHVAERWASAKPGGLVLAEDEGRYFFRQFIGAVDYCHKHGTAHRDLKLDNTLLDSQKPPFIKICDFGFARHFDTKPGLERSKSHLGTPEYMSPELLHNTEKGREALEEYDPRSVDVWAAGVMLVVALCGAFPFDHTRAHMGFTDDQELDLWLQEVNKTWSESPFIADNVGALSPNARDLLNRIFELDPRRRITVPEIMRHPWYVKPLQAEQEAALKRLEQEQAQVDEHIRHRKTDPVKEAQRAKQLEEMLEQACSREAFEEASTHGRQLRPLHVIPGQRKQLMRVDLTERAVLVRESCNLAEEHATVADRAAGLTHGRSGDLHHLVPPN